jgi:methionyl-tRNA synthetase
MNYVKANKYFITTPIFYVNASPHIGHLHSALLADAQNRFQIALGLNDTYFTTGTDEHGLKIQKAADSFNYSDPQLFCNDVSKKYSNLFSNFGINYSEFIRTSEDRHKVKKLQRRKQIKIIYNITESCD